MLAKADGGAPRRGRAWNSLPVSGSKALTSTGVRFVPVGHAGNSTDSAEEAIEVAALIRGLLDAQAAWADDKGRTQRLALDDILAVAPSNAHVARIGKALAGVGVGTVDKFQGQQAVVSIYSMATSSPGDVPRGMEFLHSLNRLNVATSRAFCLAAVVASPAPVRVQARTPRQMRLANALCRFVEMSADPDRPAGAGRRWSQV